MQNTSPQWKSIVGFETHWLWYTTPVEMCVMENDSKCGYSLSCTCQIKTFGFLFSCCKRKKWIKTRNSFGILSETLFYFIFFPNKGASHSVSLHTYVYKHGKFRFPICRRLMEKKKSLNSPGSIKKKRTKKPSPGGLQRSSFSYLRIMDTMWGSPGPTDEAMVWMKERNEEVAYLCFPKSPHPEIICCILR